MNNIETTKELLELKEQMLVLKKQLNKEKILSEEQVSKVTRIHKSNRLPIIQIFVGALCMLNVISFSYILFFKEKNLSESQLAIFITISALLLISYIVFISGVRTYSIKDGKIIIGHRLKIPKSKTINIDSIRFIEIQERINFIHRTLRIGYNKYDECFVGPKNKEEFISDLLRINPEIDIKKEKIL